MAVVRCAVRERRGRDGQRRSERREAAAQRKDRRLARVCAAPGRGAAFAGASHRPNCIRGLRRTEPGLDEPTALVQGRGPRLFEQRGAAVPAERGAAAVHRAAGAALAVDAGLGARQQPLDLVQLGVGLLQLGGFAREHVEPVVVADRHLVGEPAEVPGQLGDTLGELAAAAAQLLHRACRPLCSAARPPTGSSTPEAGLCGSVPGARRGCRSPSPSASARFDRLGAQRVDFFLVLFAVGLGQFVDLLC